MISGINGKENLFNSLVAPAYSIAETSRLTGISRGRIRRYLHGYEYKYETKYEVREGEQPPVVDTPKQETIYASFLDLTDLYFVNEFLERGFSLQKIRLALDDAKRYLGTPHFSRSVFYTSGSQIFLTLPNAEGLIALLTGGQMAISEIIKKFGEKLDFEDVTGFGYARRFYPKGKDALIVIDPQIAFGRPVLIGRGITTSTIYDLFLGENKQVKPVKDWFNVSVPEVKAAVRFEHNLWA
jgi:uncharacterized protein (DUF433 family)/DNA-binding transcriptional MerR regulator